MGLKLVRVVAVQLETCHANSDGTAWYAICKKLAVKTVKAP